MGLDEVGKDELAVGRNGYYTKWVLDELGFDEQEMGEVGMDELATRRSGCGRSGRRTSRVTEVPFKLLF